MSKKIDETLNTLKEKQMTKVVFRTTNVLPLTPNVEKKKEGIVGKETTIPSDSWNSGCDSRVILSAECKWRIFTSKEVNEFFNPDSGPDSDRLIGVWVDQNKFRYNF